jgi:amidase
MDELGYLPAGVLAERLRRREVSASEVLDAYLDRIDRHNPPLGAVISVNLDQARQAAAAADRSLAAGADVGPLCGVPMTLKDGYDVAGLRTTVGSAVFDRIATEDSTVAARLRAAGAIIVGHSNVPPFLAAYVTDNPLFGRTSNPWNPDRTPGGSSGGAAAALAAGLTPVEVGSDLAGSLRLPAHFCGVYGLKSTEHRVSTTGFFRPRPGVPRSVRILGAPGPMARDLDDLDLILRLIAGPDGRDTEVPPVPLPARHQRPLAGLRLAVASELPGTTVAPSLHTAVEHVAAAATDAGAAVTPQLPQLDWADQQQLFGELVEVITGVFNPTVQLDGERQTLAWYLAALHRRDAFIGAWGRFFDTHQALILPPATTTAFDHDTTGHTPGRHRRGGDRLRQEQATMLVFANLAGLPALTVPAGRDSDGLPVGVQIVGPRWSEVRLLEIATALEDASVLPGFARPPGY